jgi:RNA polymerase sigma-70 factor (ECF subfamily)
MDARTTHASLIARLADRADEAAWREFGERYGSLIRGFALRRGLSGPEVDDIVQEVHAALLGSMPTFRYDPAKGRFRGYLKTIAVRAIQRRIFQKGRIRSLGEIDSGQVDPPAGDDAEQEREWEAEWRQYHMRRAMRTIEVEFSPLDRMAFRRYGVEGVSVAATAEELGLSVDQVYQAKSRIVRRLAELVAEQVAEEG